MKQLIRKTVAIVVFTVAAIAIAQAAEDSEILERTKIPGAADYIDSNEVYAITYSSDGLKVKGYLVMPTGEGPFPCLIVNRGGNRDFGAISDIVAILWLGQMADWGYIVIASQYRGVAGGEGMEEFGGADVDDVLNLIPILDSIPRADASRIGMWGASRGGLMTYLALARTDRIRAAVVSAGISDSYDTVKRRPGMETGVYAELVPDWKAKRDSALTARSPVRWVDQLPKETVLLLIHGSADWRVHPSQTLNMADSLLEYEHPYRLVIFEGADHGLTEFRGEESRLSRDFLDHYVRDNSPLPNMEPHGD
jgi:dipeptidyl aminopeptidase/acylaminoacyl peptidase